MLCIRARVRAWGRATACVRARAFVHACEDQVRVEAYLHMCLSYTCMCEPACACLHVCHSVREHCHDMSLHPCSSHHFSYFCSIISSVKTTSVTTIDSEQ